MEKPLFVALEPRVFAVQHGAPLEGRVFVTDRSRWYERMKDQNGNAYFAHLADSDEEFQRVLVEQGEPDIVEMDDELADVVLREFSRAGRLQVEVPVVTDEGLAA